MATKDPKKTAVAEVTDKDLAAVSGGRKYSGQSANGTIHYGKASHYDASTNLTWYKKKGASETNGDWVYKDGNNLKKSTK